MSDEPYCYSYSLKDNNDERQRLLAKANALVQPCPDQDEVHAAALLILAVASLQDDEGNVAAGECHVQKAWSILQTLGDVRGAAYAGLLLTRILLAQGSLDAALNIQDQLVADLEHSRMNWYLCEAYWLRIRIKQQQNDCAGVVQILQRIAKIADREEFVSIIHDVYLSLEHFDPAMALVMGQQLLARQRQEGTFTMLCLALHQLGRVCLNAGHYRRAQELLDEALQLYPRRDIALKAPPSPQWTLMDRGQVARLQGDAELAMACFDESVRLFNASPVPTFSKFPLLFRAQVHFEEEPGAALVDFRHCLRLALIEPEEWDVYVFNCLAGIAEVVRQRGGVVTAATLYAKAAVMEAAWRAAGNYNQPHVMTFYERLMAAVPQHRQDTAFEAAWQEGGRLSLDKTVELAWSW